MKKESNWLDAFCKFYTDHMPNTIVFKKCKERYDQILSAIDTISKFVYATNPEAKIEYHTDELIGDRIVLEIVTDEIIVDNLKSFCDSMKIAANFEVYPRTDGTIQFNVVFNDAYSVVTSY